MTLVVVMATSPPLIGVRTCNGTSFLATLEGGGGHKAALRATFNTTSQNEGI